ncbi:MAG: diaminopimelate epimerase [Alphaproteobacteria bacterium]|nr:diaminopimelate epimerase [Alphaproteobacteria bacterium]MDE1985854.1 diaminopimelate epimerase [Alphaproteobacteria bacterium]MDE2163266.1 diaminopimelate epimerase [Alphaproteobacteria bacterium]MDE2264683.1 diaminopimelate epimerase [Alphaproteobacteria bacterium]MDE2498769.1 diaminopimelate epimerase [Alphaproteobacteria bacterium]
MHGLGNDFVVFDARKQGLALDATAARAIADRRRGVGCDQVIVIEQGVNDADVVMRIFNGDGGEVESCGNAARCVARLLMEEKDHDTVRIDTLGGLLICTDAGNGMITVDMGAPNLMWDKVPLARPADTNRFALNVDGESLMVSAVSVGNPHCVLFVDDADAAPVASLGPRIETHPMFPKRTNVEFASVRDRAHLRMRVWERGAGITQACGSGTCAVAVAAHRRGLIDAKVEVALDGGVLAIELRESDGHILMTGPATLSFRGEIDFAGISA